VIGVFDSGAGGLAAINEIRKIAKDADVCFLADRENAPYGTKTLEEITRFSKRNIEKLLSFGAEKILIACCTASAAYERLSEFEKSLSLPIIDVSAKRAVELTKNGRIGVIATERTVKEKAFAKAVLSISKTANVFELAAQDFVGLVENGARDGNLSDSDKTKIASVLLPLRDKGIDTLILGCTHFSHIEKEIRRILGIKTVNPALEGAREIIKFANTSENGRTIYV
jgi:glutamate racemase